MDNAPTTTPQSGTDLLEWPVIGRFLRWRYARPAMQLPLLLGAIVMVAHGFVGPQLAPRNLASLLTWVHYRGVLIVVLLVAGNFFCMACPFMLTRDWARRFFKPALNWPRWLRNKWLAVGLLVAVLFAYELFDLWGTPWWTAWLIIGYFAAALAVDALFKQASFCKYVCPIGQFNFAASTFSPLEVKVRDTNTCATCTTVDCIKGTRHPDDRELVLQRGCELALFQPEKVGNMDCTFCLDCIHACPHDNVGITTRLPGSELWDDTRRSGIGLFSKRKDLAALAAIFMFGALLNAFGMVSPVYAVQQWIATQLGTTNEVPVLAILFVALLIVEPVLLMGGAALWTRRATGTPEPLMPIMTRFAYALIPLACGVWAAHYGFHLLTGLWTFIPVTQAAFADFGLPLLGEPMWQWTGFSTGAVYPLEIGLISLGLLGTLLVGYRIAERDYPRRARRVFIPWAVLAVVLWASALWLLSQPMEMRGTMLGG